MENLTLIEKLELYKKLSIEMKNIIETDYEKIDEKLNKRQEIINSIKESERQIASKLYMDLNLNVIDEDIKNEILLNMKKIKVELKEYRQNKAINFMYSRNKKEKINIFSKKV